MNCAAAGHKPYLHNCCSPATRNHMVIWWAGFTVICSKTVFWVFCKFDSERVSRWQDSVQYIMTRASFWIGAGETLHLQMGSGGYRAACRAVNTQYGNGENAGAPTLWYYHHTTDATTHLPEAPLFNLRKDVEAVISIQCYFKFSGQHNKHRAPDMYLGKCLDTNRPREH